jgi:hypothetical protein
MNGKGWLVPDHALWLARMVAQKCVLESGRRRMNAEAVMVPSRGPVIVGQQGAPMSDLGNDHRRGFEALIDGLEDCHLHGLAG